MMLSVDALIRSGVMSKGEDLEKLLVDLKMSAQYGGEEKLYRHVRGTRCPVSDSGR